MKDLKTISTDDELRNLLNELMIDTGSDDAIIKWLLRHLYDEENHRLSENDAYIKSLILARTNIIIYLLEMRKREISHSHQIPDLQRKELEGAQ